MAKPAHRRLQRITIEGVTALADTPDEVGPYVVDATIFTNFGATLATTEIFYRVGGVGTFTSTPMANVGGNMFSGEEQSNR